MKFPKLDRFTKIVLVAVMLSGIILFNFNLITPSKPSSAIYHGISFYGLAETASLFRLYENTLFTAKQLFPNMNLVYFQIGTNTKTGTNYDLLMNHYLPFCASNNIKVILTMCAWGGLGDETAMTTFWEFWTQKLVDHDEIYMFDIMNEPWDSRWNTEEPWWRNSELVNVYERVIDKIRAIDSDRICGVQSYLKHEDTLSWVRTNPVAPTKLVNGTPAVVYIAHFYGQSWEDGHWRTEWFPWTNHYINGEFADAKKELEAELYRRFGFVKQELGLPVVINEISWVDDDTIAKNSLRHGKDVIDILNGWGIPWTYYCWSGGVGSSRPACIIDDYGNYRMTLVNMLNENI